MTKKEVIESLDSISGKDPESAHSEADDIIFKLLDPDVASAYNRVIARCPWWGSA